MRNECTRAIQREVLYGCVMLPGRQEVMTRQAKWVLIARIQFM